MTDISRKTSAFPYQFLFHPLSKLIYRKTLRDLSSAAGHSIEKCVTTGFREGFCVLNTALGRRVGDKVC